MTKSEIQKISDEICSKYGVSKIPIRTTDRKYRGGLAYYATYRVKIGGKIQKKHYPKFIMICDWDEIKRTGRFPILQVAHELAHHILNIKTGSLRHTGRQGDLEDKIGLYISKRLKQL